MQAVGKNKMTCRVSPCVLPGFLLWTFLRPTYPNIQLRDVRVFLKGFEILTQKHRRNMDWLHLHRDEPRDSGSPEFFAPVAEAFF